MELLKIGVGKKKIKRIKHVREVATNSYSRCHSLAVSGHHFPSLPSAFWPGDVILDQRGRPRGYDVTPHISILKTTHALLREQCVRRTEGTFWLALPHSQLFLSLPVPPCHSFPLPALIPLSPSLSHSVCHPISSILLSFPSSRSHPHSPYTWGSCSFIANWTFHSERNNYSLERKGTAVECWYDTQCHLATQELPAHPAQREGRERGADGTGRGRDWVRERQGWGGLWNKSCREVTERKKKQGRGNHRARGNCVCIGKGKQEVKGVKSQRGQRGRSR